MIKEINRILERCMILLVMFFLFSGEDVKAESYSGWSETYPTGQIGI